MRLLSRLTGAGAALACAIALTGCGSSGTEEPTVFATPISTSSASSETVTETVSETATDTTTAGASASKHAPDCSKQALMDSGFESYMEIVTCEGGFARVAQPQSDNIGIAQWKNGKWDAVAFDSTYTSGSTSGCYTPGLLDGLGVPERVRVFVCDPASIPSSQGGGSSYYLQNGIIVSAGLGEAGEDASYPACDGRAILILDSVVDEGNDGGAMHDIAQQVLMMHPSGKPVRFTVPGACPSLRAQLNGQNIYPIYIDYGSDVDAMCRAKATYGGNGRILSNSAEFVDPC